MILLWLALVARAEEPVDTDSSDDPLLHASGFQFCTDPGLMTEEAREWCDVVQEIPDDRCAAFQAWCANTTATAAPPTDFMGCQQPAPAPGNTPPPNVPKGCGNDGFSGAPTPPTPTPQTPPPNFPSCDPPQQSAGPMLSILRWFVAIFVVAILALVVRWLISWWSLRWKPKPVAPPPVPVQVDVLSEAVPVAPSADLLAAAREALAAGRLDEAVLLARAAALRRLEEKEKLTLHRSRTDREYLRQLKRTPELHDPMKELIRTVEEVRFGKRAISADRAKHALSAAERLLAALMAALLAWTLAAPEDALANRYESSGDAAIQPLFSQAGYEATWRLRGLGTLDDQTHIVVLDLSRVELGAEDEVSLRKWCEDGGLLYVAGDASAIFPDLGVRFALPAGLAVNDARTRATAVPVLPTGPLYAWQNGKGVYWLTVDIGGNDYGVVQALSVGLGGVISVADERLFWNGAMLVPANEAFLIEAPYYGVDDGLWNVPIPAKLEVATRGGDDATTPWSSLKKAGLLPVALQLLLAGALLAWSRGWPFAPLRDLPTDGRTRFPEHVHAVAVHWMRRGASRRALSMGAAYWLARLGARALFEAARRSGYAKGDAESLIAELEDAAAHPEGPNQRTDLDRLEELWKLTHRP